MERDGPGRLVGQQPARRAERDERARCATSSPTRGSSSTPIPKVKVIVHTGEGRAFQTGVDVTELATDGLGMERYRESVENWDLHFTAWHQGVDKPVITAVNGICAGGGFHWVADADIVIAASDAQFFDPHVSVGQVVAIEAIGLAAQDAVRGGDAHGARRSLRADVGAAGVRARDDLADRRSARAVARAKRRSWPRRSPRTRRRRCVPPSGRCGARSRWGSPTRAAPARRSWCRCGATRTRRKAPPRSPRSASPSGGAPRRARALTGQLPGAVRVDEVAPEHLADLAARQRVDARRTRPAPCTARGARGRARRAPRRSRRRRRRRRGPRRAARRARRPPRLR